MQPAVSCSYVLLSPLSAVRLTDHAEAEGGFCVLPAGEVVAVNGRSSITGLIDILCAGQAYGVFLTDLEERGQRHSHEYPEHSRIRFRIPD
jgi:hypothetical protein